MKIGVLTFHRARNYGAFLQAFSLCEKLNSEEGIEAEIIDFHMVKEVEHYKEKLSKRTIYHPLRYIHDIIDSKKQTTLFEDSLKEMRLSAKYVNSDSVDNLAEVVNGQYDAIVVGSDEVWKTNGLRGFPNPYWLYSNISCKKYSYAASARSDFHKLSDENLKILQAAVRSFEYIGVRDHITLEAIREFADAGQVVKLCCDPTFLYEFKPDKNRGKRILSERFSVDTNKKIIAIMTENRNISKRIRAQMSSDGHQLISLYQWQPGCIDCSSLSPFEWIDVIAAVDLLMTSFFHAVCFAAKFGVPMIAFGTKGKASKVSEVIDMVGRTVDYYEDIQEVVNNGIDKLVCEKINNKTEKYVPNSVVLEGYNELVNSLKATI